MNKHVIKLWPFTTLDYRYAEIYLENMAQKGFLLGGFGNRFSPIVWYKKTRPINVKFCIDGYKHESNLEDDQNYNEYLQIARTKGWNHVCEKNYVQYFVSNNNANPLPIQSNDKDELQAVKMVFSNFELIFSIILFSVAILFWLLIKALDENIIDIAASKIGLFIPWIISYTLLLANLFRYFIFVRQGTKGLRSRKEISNSSVMMAKIRGYMFNLAVLTFVIPIAVHAYLLPFRQYKETGSAILLVCGVFILACLCLLELGNIVKQMHKDGNKIGDQINRWALVGLLLCFIIVGIQMIYF